MLRKITLGAVLLLMLGGAATLLIGLIQGYPVLIWISVSSLGLSCLCALFTPPIRQTKPTASLLEPADAAGPVHATGPVGPAGPFDAAEPAASAGPAEPTQPAGP